jgi:NTE family protein
LALAHILRNVPLFRNLNNQDLEFVASFLKEESYTKGAIVFQEGDLGETMYLVKSGQVAVMGQDTKETIAFMGPGSFAGEISLLLSEPRTATLQVIIDAELWVFHRDDFEYVINTRPAIAREMMRELGRRLIETTQRKRPLRRRQITALFDGRQAMALCQAICDQLGQPVGLVQFPGAVLPANIGLSSDVILLSPKDLTEATLVQALGYQVEIFGHVVLLMPEQPGPLVYKALHLADTIVCIDKAPARLDEITLKCDRWQVGPGQSEILRTARRLTNRTVGLALSSGGARGLAHVGVMKVLLKENIPIDMVAGTSGGAWFGALLCAGWTPDQFDEFVHDIKKIILRLPNADFNFPPKTAIFKGRRARDRVIGQSVGVETFEELAIPFYVIAADILTGDELVFESGSLTDAIRASLSVPVLFDPWFYQGHYCVDGGVVNPLPASVLRQRGADIIIGSSVIQPLEQSYSGRKDKKPHILQSVFNIVSAMESEVVKKQLPLIDVLIQHHVSAKHTLDFEHARAVVRQGEEAARQMLPDIKAALAPADTL